MRRSLSWKPASIAGLLMVAMFHGSLASAQTTDFILTQDYCSGGCGPGPYGTVAVTSISATEVGVSVTLSAGELFANTGAGLPLMFNIAGNPTLSISGLSSGFSFVTAPFQAAGGTGTWNYGMQCSACGNGTSPPNYSALAFDVSLASGISAASFAANGAGLIFGSDIYANGNTGPVGATGQVSAPEIDASSAASGLTLLLGGLVVLRGRKQQRIAA